MDRSMVYGRLVDLRSSGKCSLQHLLIRSFSGPSQSAEDLSEGEVQVLKEFMDHFGENEHHFCGSQCSLPIG